MLNIEDRQGILLHPLATNLCEESDPGSQGADSDLMHQKRKTPDRVDPSGVAYSCCSSGKERDEECQVFTRRTFVSCRIARKVSFRSTPRGLPLPPELSGVNPITGVFATASGTVCRFFACVHRLRQVHLWTSVDNSSTSARRTCFHSTPGHTYLLAFHRRFSCTERH
jgi:hypothetical protein